MDHTAHDTGHSERVIGYINRIVDLMEERGETFSRSEIRLLYMASWLHDIGNLKKGNRSNHARESCKMIERLGTKYLHLDHLEDPLLFVVRAHQSSYEITKVPETPQRFENDVIRLRLIASVFRLADSCDMGSSRAHQLVYFVLKEDVRESAKKHWVANSAIISVDLDPKRKAIVVTVSSRRKTSFLTGQFEEDFAMIRPYLGQSFPLKTVIIDKAVKYR